MDIRAAVARRRNGGGASSSSSSSSTRRARIDPGFSGDDDFDDPDDGLEMSKLSPGTRERDVRIDWTGVEVDGVTVGSLSPQRGKHRPSPRQPRFDDGDPAPTSATRSSVRRPQRMADNEEHQEEEDDDDDETPKRRLGGHVAAAYYGQRRAVREKQREKQRVADATPKNIEKALQEQRARNKRRKQAASICPNPVRGVRRFLRDPVTRFWLGCNICCTFFLFSAAFIFMVFLYPLLLRSVTRY